MSNKFNHEEAANADILARPNVSERPENEDIAAVTPEQAPDKAPEREVDLEPDALEKSAGKLFSKTIDELKKNAGGQSDHDFNVLVTEVLTGIFAGMRTMTGRPWVRFVVAGSALLFAAVPAAMTYQAAKAEKKDSEE